MKKTNKTKIRKYAIGKPASYIGYQRGNNYVDTSLIDSTPAGNLNSATDAIRQGYRSNALAKLGEIGTNVYNLYTQTSNVEKPLASSSSLFMPSSNAVMSTTNAFTPSTLTTAANSLSYNTANLLTPTLSGTTGSLAANTSNLLMQGTTDALTSTAANASLGINVGGDMLMPTTTSTTSSAASGALSTAGTVLGALGAAYGAYNLGTSIYNSFKSPLNIQDLQSQNGRSVEQIGNVGYEQITPMSYGTYKDYIGSTKTAGKVNSALGGMGTGASIGGLIGTSAGPVGTLIGSGIGALIGAGIGLFGGWLGGESMEDKMTKMYRNYAFNTRGWNTQSESEARSQAIRDEFYGTSTKPRIIAAKTGKEPSEGSKTTSTGNKIDIVQNPEGYTVGPITAKVEPGEIMYRDGTTNVHTVTGGTPGKDSVDSDTVEGDDIGILSNQYNRILGMSPADYARRSAAEIERVNNIKISQNPEVAKVQQREINKVIAENMPYIETAKQAQAADKQLKAIEEDMNTIKKYKCGKYKCGKYADGKMLSWALAPALMGSVAGLQSYYDYKGETPSKYNPYTPNAAATGALETLASLQYDPYRAIQSARDAQRQAMYNINQAGNLTPGQKMHLLLANYNNTNKAIADIEANSQQLNNQYKAAAAQAALQEGRAEAAAKTQGDTYMYESLAKAQAARRLGMEKARNSIADSWYKGFQNLFNLNQFEKMYGLYADDRNLEWLKAGYDNINNIAIKQKPKFSSKQYSNISLDSVTTPTDKWMFDYNLKDIYSGLYSAYAKNGYENGKSPYDAEVTLPEIEIIGSYKRKADTAQKRAEKAEEQLNYIKNPTKLPKLKDLKYALYNSFVPESNLINWLKLNNFRYS